MKTAVATIVAAVLVTAASYEADPARCRLRSGLYEQRIALAAAPGGGGDAQAEIDREYAGFFSTLAEVVEAQDTSATQSCCVEVGEDRIGQLSCQLVDYLVRGRTDAAGFLGAFPVARKDVAALWDLEAISAIARSRGTAVPKAFLPRGPGYRYIDELFLLVLDGREEAIMKYFTLSGLATGEPAQYIDQKLDLMLREAPNVLVGNWFIIRKFKPKVKSAIQSFVGTATQPEIQRVTAAVNAFCAKDDPDCKELLKLFPKK